MKRFISRLLRAWDRHRTPAPIWITPDQYRLYQSCYAYRSKRYQGPTHQ